jgi:hypothetical protein
MRLQPAKVEPGMRLLRPNWRHAHGLLQLVGGSGGPGHTENQ